MTRPQVFTYSVTTPPRLVDRTQFENIILRSDENGGALRLKDVARVELGALAYGFAAHLQRLAGGARSPSTCSPAPTPCR